MKIKYIKTNDPNIFIEVNTSGRNIFFDKLELEIFELQQQIDTLPKPKTKPDQETLDFYNAEIEIHGEKEMFEMQLKEKKDLLDILESIKAVEMLK